MRPPLPPSRSLSLTNAITHPNLPFCLLQEERREEDQEWRRAKGGTETGATVARNQAAEWEDPARSSQSPRLK